MKKFSFCFPGQGTQFVQMGRTFYDSHNIARQTYEEASAIANRDVAQLCFSGSFSQISLFTNMQIAIVTTEVAIFRSYMDDYGIPPLFLIGHSIGEYAALVCSGAIDFSDCIKVLVKRGELIQKILDKTDGRMTIVENVTEKQVLDVINTAGLERKVSLACYNSKSQFAVSGENEALEVFESNIVGKNAIMTPLLQSPPIHSRMMEEVRDEFSDYLEKIRYYPFEYPVLCNLTGRPVSDRRHIPLMLSEHLIKPVQFAKSIEYMQKFGVEAVIEMSPKLLLSLLINDINPDITTYCYGLEKDRESLHTHFHGDPSYAKDKPDFLGICLSLLASTPNNNINNDNQRVSEIYNKMKKEYMEASESKFSRSTSNDRQLLKQLIEAMRIKNIPDEEIHDLIRTLIFRTNKMYTYDDTLTLQ